MTAPTKPAPAKTDAPKPVPSKPATAGSVPAPRVAKAKKDTEPRDVRFRRIAGIRLPKALYSIQRLEALGGPAYDCTPEQAAKVVAMLREAVTYVEDALTRKSTGKVDPRKPIVL